MAGIKEVADMAGVSTATVSRVLANKPHVRPEVREKVLQAVQALDYRPNLVARSLRSQQSSTIGLVVSDIRNPFFTAIARAVEDAAYEQGFRVFMCNTDENPEKEGMYLNLMRDENVAGVIFSPTRQTALRFAELEVGIPTVVIDREVSAACVDVVLINNVAAARQLAEHLIHNGYHRIGALFGEASTTGRQRRQGLEEALELAGLAVDPNLMCYVSPKIQAGHAAALSLLDLPQPPDALFTTNSLLTAGGLKAIQERGLRIPKDVALVGFDETPWSTLVQPPITLIAQPTEEIGRTATDLLLKRIEDPQRPARTVILQAQLLERGSSAPR
ncbi:MAG: LacI family DNA-binding transcriptional regulator [Chloroflexi bacterium]|nr:LacI family DNA-binding transcriptional regulator [Chloroflexota bacterium]MBP8059676.1 LacI family DNA-binding transcriptional regulator [Chloroflexota bacterium]